MRQAPGPRRGNHDAQQQDSGLVHCALKRHCFAEGHVSLERFFIQRRIGSSHQICHLCLPDLPCLVYAAAGLIQNTRSSSSKLLRPPCPIPQSAVAPARGIPGDDKSSRRSREFHPCRAQSPCRILTIFRAPVHPPPRSQSWTTGSPPSAAPQSPSSQSLSYS